MFLAPLLGQLAPKGLGQDGLGELVQLGYQLTKVDRLIILA
jgi:hypothetical protein